MVPCRILFSNWVLCFYKGYSSPLEWACFDLSFLSRLESCPPNVVLCQPPYIAYTLISSFCLQYILGTLLLTHAAVPIVQQMCDEFLLKVMKNEQKTLTEEVNCVLIMKDGEL